MKILWITNILLPPISIELGIKPLPFGGWMMSALNQLSKTNDLELGVATVYNGDTLKEYHINGVKYYLLPGKKNIEDYDSALEQEWKKIRDIFQPDVIHIHGSEYQHGHAYINACGNENVVLSIQGIISSYSRYINAGLRSFGKSVWHPVDLIKRNTIEQIMRKWEIRGEQEKLFLKKIKFVIGRTQWDKTHLWAINPYARYFFCGETMRQSFYHHKWSYTDCQPHSIFLSQAQYTIKGFHKLIEAMPLVKRAYPDVKVYIAGVNPLNSGWRKAGYRLYLERLIKRTDTIGNLEFVGSLDEQQMLEYFLKSNVFVCPSAIENSSNSIGEAQLIGMPIVASYVGGNPELLDYNNECLYRFEEIEMLADRLINIFKAEDKINVPNYSLDRYDPLKNAADLMDIYSTIATYHQ